MEHAKATSEALAHTIDQKTPNPHEYLSYIQEQKHRDRRMPGSSHGEFIFADEKMLRIRGIVEQIASANVPVLITGESGTGKEVIARCPRCVAFGVRCRRKKA